MRKRSPEQETEGAAGNRVSSTGPKGRPRQLRDGNEERDALRSVLCRPWGFRLLEAVSAGPMRFNVIKKALTGINSKTLSAILRNYENHGILQRQVISTRPLAVKYSATVKGRSLRELMSKIIEWQHSWETTGRQ